jgi:hypothetical protein
MDLTEPQRRTMEGLVGDGPAPRFPLDLPVRLRAIIEEGVRDLDPAYRFEESLWVGKEMLRAAEQCEGSFAAKLAREDPPFSHSPSSAAGVLLHKAIEVEVGAREDRGPEDTLEIAVERMLEREERFAEHWQAVDASEREEAVQEAVQRVELFRASFPPLKPLRRELTPVSEMRVRAELLDGDLICTGRIDLVLGSAVRDDPGLATRVAIDLKSGRAWPGHGQDMRFYALLMTLRFGVPPRRVSSLYLESGTWQAEDVSEELLERTAERVVEAVRIAAELTDGRAPGLRPGPHCGWCPRSTECPEAEI